MLPSEMTDELLEEAARTLERTVGEFVAAIDSCITTDKWEPTIALVFVTIDSMAWLERSPTRSDVTRTDFIDWVERHMIPDSHLPCTADELYSARCGMLHSITADSRRQREDRANIRKVYFVRARAGEADAVDALLTVQFAEPRLPVYVNVDHLVASLKRALEGFSSHLNDDEPKWRLVASRVHSSYLSRGILRNPPGPA